jgi:hypothetical protein
MFCEGVQHHLRFCLDHLSCVKMAAFQLEKQKSHRGPIQVRRVGGGDSYVVLGQKFPGENEVWDGKLSWQPVLLSPKFRMKSSRSFMQSL